MKKSGGSNLLNYEIDFLGTPSIQEELLARVNALENTFEAQQIDILLEGEVHEILYERLVKLSGKCKDEIDLLNAVRLLGMQFIYVFRTLWRSLF